MEFGKRIKTKSKKVQPELENKLKKWNHKPEFYDLLSPFYLFSCFM